MRRARRSLLAVPGLASWRATTSWTKVGEGDTGILPSAIQAQFIQQIEMSSELLYKVHSFLTRQDKRGALRE